MNFRKSKINDNSQTAKLHLVALLLLISVFVWAEQIVRVGYYPAPGLMNEAKDGATKSGYAYEYIQKVANQSGWKFSYVYGSFGELYQKLRSGEIDMLPYVTKTPARTGEVLFPDLKMGDERLYIGSMKPARLGDSLVELNGRKIGLIKGAFSNAPFMELLKEKGVTCELIEYSLAEERSAAIASGAVDYVVELSTSRQNIDLHAVYEFGERYPFYLAVASGRPDLLAELNRVLNNIDRVNPSFLNTLMQKYFKGMPIFKAIPEEGMAWLDSHKVIRIGTYDHDSPYAIEHEDGTASGIGPEYVTFMLNALNLTIPVEWKFFDGREAALKALRAEEIDLINPYYFNYGDAEDDGVVVSAPVFRASFSVLYQDKYTDETMDVVATPSTRLGTMYVRDNYPDAKIIPCQNGYDCIAKLLSGEANCVVVHTSALTEIASKYNRGFHLKPLNATCPVCFATLPKNVALLAAIDKAIPFLTDVDLNAILDKYSHETEDTITIGQFCRMHPEYIYGIVAVLIALGSAVVLLKVRKDKQIAEKTRKAQMDAMIDGISSKYNVAYIVNLVDDSCRLLRMDEGIIGHGKSFENFTQAKDFFITGPLHPADRGFMTRELDNGTIRRRLESEVSYTVEYRVLAGNKTIWHEMTITSIGNDEIGIGFAIKDLEIIERHLEEKRYSENFALFAVDVDTGMLKVVKNEGPYDVVPIGESAPFTQYLLNMAKEVDEEASKMLTMFSKPDFVKEELASEDKRTFSYKSNHLPGKKWVDVTIYAILRHEDGTLAMFSMGFSMSDSRTIERQELQRQRNEAMQMIGGLASSYNALYYINIDEDTMNIYALDETKYPGSRAIFEGKKNGFIKIIGGYGLSEQVHPDDRHLFEDFNPEGIRRKLTGRKKWSMRFRVATDNGYRWDEMELIKNEDINEQANAVAVGFTDRDSEIRREQEYQQQLEAARVAAEAANTAKTNFLFSMSHDIRTPMNAITGFTNMAVKHIDNKEKTLDCLDKIQKSGNMLLSLINSVLEVSRIESGHATLEEQYGDIFYSFANIENTLQELAKTKDIDLSFEFGEISDRFVYADFSRCMRIFVNVISNAIKYTNEGGFVKVRCEQIGEAKDGYATYKYTIADNGIGMSEEFQKHVFEQFARENTATVSGIQGTGLGMSVVKSFVELMGGTIGVKSKQGEGTIFTIILQFKIQEGKLFTDPETGDLVNSVEQSRTAKDVDFTGRRVLLVEDNELNREIASEILGEEGLVVEEAEDGSKAVEMLKEKGPDYYDFVLMDVQMPIMNGYEATKTIRAMYPDAKLPIVALSANAFAEDKQKSLEAGMNDHVAKPIKIKELFAALAKFL